MRDTYKERTIGRISCFCHPRSYWSMDNDDPSWICTVRTRYSDVPSPASNASHTSCSIWPSQLATNPGDPSSWALLPGLTMPLSSGTRETGNTRNWKLWNRSSLVCSMGDLWGANVFRVSPCTNRKCKNSCSRSCHRAPVIQSVQRSSTRKISY
jgi:hypothetical protein